MKKQKQYADNRSVLAEIYSAERRINQMMTEHIRLDGEAKAFFKSGNAPQGQFCRDESNKILKSIGRIESGKLARLKQTLSTIQSGDLFGVTSTVLQKA